MTISVNAPPTRSRVAFTVNGRPVSAAPGTTVAAALMREELAAHPSVTGGPRGPLCAMGICMECCATVDGIKHVRTCQLNVRPGMNVVTE